MPPVPRLTFRQVVKVLTVREFALSRGNGSHHIYRHADGRWTVVPTARRQRRGGLFTIERSRSI